MRCITLRFALVPEIHCNVGHDAGFTASVMQRCGEPREELYTPPPPPPHHFGQKAFLREMGGVYISNPPAAGIYTPPSFARPPPLPGNFQGWVGGVYKIWPRSELRAEGNFVQKSQEESPPETKKFIWTSCKRGVFGISGLGGCFYASKKSQEKTHALNFTQHRKVHLNKFI